MRNIEWRLHAQTATIENGFVYLPIEAYWLGDYLHVLTIFPAGPHDDQVDSTAQALAWTKQRPLGWGMLEFYRKQYEMGRIEEPVLLDDGAFEIRIGKLLAQHVEEMEVRPLMPPPDGRDRRASASASRISRSSAVLWVQPAGRQGREIRH